MTHESGGVWDTRGAVAARFAGRDYEANGADPRAHSLLLRENVPSLAARAVHVRILGYIARELAVARDVKARAARLTARAS